MCTWNYFFSITNIYLKKCVPVAVASPSATWPANIRVVVTTWFLQTAEIRIVKEDASTFVAGPGFAVLAAGGWEF